MSATRSPASGGLAERRRLQAPDRPRRSGRHRHAGRRGPFQQPPALPEAKPWQALPLNAEQSRNNPFVIPESQRPDVIVRWADADELLVSGLLDNGGAIAQRAAVVDARYGKGNVLLFANNPIWRGETIGSYAMVFNAVVNYDRLH